MSLEKLALMPSLINLNCDHQIVIEEEEWSQKKPFPTLKEMDQRREEWVLAVNEARVKAGLRTIRITFTQNVGPGMILGGSGGGSASATTTEVAPGT